MWCWTSPIKKQAELRFAKGKNMSQQKRECWNATFETALTVLERGWANIDQLRRVNAWRLTQRPRIGKLALSHGKLTMADVFAVLSEQSASGKMFGETAVDLGLLNNGEVYELLLQQAEITPSLAESLVTRGVITAEQAALAAHVAKASVVHVTSEDDLVEAASARS